MMTKLQSILNNLILDVADEVFGASHLKISKLEQKKIIFF